MNCAREWHDLNGQVFVCERKFEHEGAHAVGCPKVTPERWALWSRDVADDPDTPEHEIMLRLRKLEATVAALVERAQ